jgi:hypothetical protein
MEQMNKTYKIKFVDYIWEDSAMIQCLQSMRETPGLMSSTEKISAENKAIYTCSE